jgi:DNA mismatch endonuclease (patch repair protein)
MMAAIGGRDTAPELALRRALHAMGFRYRLHSRKLRGRPDIVLPRYHAVVFVHGCFWHRHEGCRFATTPATRTAFWNAKFAVNVARDAEVKRELLREGWRVATVWECALRDNVSRASSTSALSSWVYSASDQIEIG